MENMLACFPKRSRLSLIKILLLQHTTVLMLVSVRVCLPESPFTSGIEKFSTLDIIVVDDADA